jgi:c-di-GMP-binding flagellar brake protein YcgR
MSLDLENDNLMVLDQQLAGNNRRRYERVSPQVEDTMHVKTNSGFFLVLDISEGGVALLAPGMCVGQRIMGVLRLPGVNRTIKVTMSIKNVRPNGSCGAEFEVLDERSRNDIKVFVEAHAENPDSSVEFQMYDEKAVVGL